MPSIISFTALSVSEPVRAVNAQEAFDGLMDAALEMYGIVNVADLAKPLRSLGVSASARELSEMAKHYALENSINCGQIDFFSPEFWMFHHDVSAAIEAQADGDYDAIDALTDAAALSVRGHEPAPLPAADAEGLLDHILSLPAARRLARILSDATGMESRCSYVRDLIADAYAALRRDSGAARDVLGGWLERGFFSASDLASVRACSKALADFTLTIPSWENYGWSRAAAARMLQS